MTLPNLSAESQLLSLARGLEGDEPHHHPALAAAQEAGFVIGNRYGWGGSAEVWSAFSSRTGRRVALKVARDAGAKQLIDLEHEARILAELHGASGFDAPGFGGSGIESYIVMPLLEGKTLPQSLQSCDSTSGKLILRSAIERVAQVHRYGVIHGDIKPQHLIILDNGRCALIDFGLARRIDDTSLSVTRTGVTRGSTPEFAAPELVGKSIAPTLKTDVFALGATFRSIASVTQGPLRSCLTDLGAQCTSKIPHDRPEDATSVLKAFDHWWKQRKRKRFATQTGFTLSLITGLAFFSASTFVSTEPAPNELASSFAREVYRHQSDAIVHAFDQLDTLPNTVSITGIQDDLPNYPILRSSFSPKRRAAWSDGALIATAFPSQTFMLPNEADGWKELVWIDDDLIALTRDGDLWRIDSEPKKLKGIGSRIDRAAAGSDGNIWVWSSQTGLLLTVDLKKGSTSTLATADNARPLGDGSGAWMAFERGNAQWTVRFIGLSGWEHIEVVLGQEQHPVCGAYDSKNDVLFLGMTDGSVAGVYKTRHINVYKHVADGAIASIAVFPNGNYLLAGGSKVALLDVRSGKILAKRAHETGGPAWDLADLPPFFVPDNVRGSGWVSLAEPEGGA